MRTTLNIDDDLLEQMIRRFPPGTPKTVIIEQSLRIALNEPSRPSDGTGRWPDDVARLISHGILVPAARTGPPPQTTGGPLPAGALLRDLAADREDR